ncbi:NACHT, LRR and PYD domains-containing protein 3-like [Brachyhypopomus gauderio]|uniref:NACHT, LRR and PYD domains-containing protein 3-like n=1 Tax=Brachyhypopomus gauderio TaxID=698409 RepID=UPI0040413466
MTNFTSCSRSETGLTADMTEATSNVSHTSQAASDMTPLTQMHEMSLNKAHAGPVSEKRYSHLESLAPPLCGGTSVKNKTFMESVPSCQDEVGSTTQSSRPASPVHSCVSIKSDCSIQIPPTLQAENTSISEAVVQEKPLLSPTSHLSFKSDWSMEQPVRFTDKSYPSGYGIKQHPEKRTDQSISFTTSRSEMSMSLAEDELNTTLKSTLKNRFQRLSDGLQNPSCSTLLNDIYTELYITEGGVGEVNNEHEVRRIEVASRRHLSAEDTPIKCNDIFNPLPGQDKPIKTMLTKGVAGIGKTVSVQKFILDWAEGKANQDVHYIFPLLFRELNLLRDQKYSLNDLLQRFFLIEVDITSLEAKDRCLIFIFDGLDECRLNLDFQNNENLWDITTATSVDVLLTNLINGKLLPSAHIWITSRPAAASQIPTECVSQVTEIRGFGDPQKEEYFRKRIIDQSLATRTIAHLKSSRSLYIMCHIPVFCWISATVLERMLRETEGAAVPKTLTQMYTHFLIQMCMGKRKYTDATCMDKEMIFKLGQLAFRQLVKGNLIFYEEDLNECGIDVKDAVVYSGVCTQVFREEFELHCGKGKVFCFVHLSIQEHLAALYVYMAFSEGDGVVLNCWRPRNSENMSPCSSICDLYQSAVDRTLQNRDGQFDLFLRFLLGLSQESNHSLLRMLLPEMPVWGPQSMQETIEYIKIRIRMNPPPEKYINLFYCLNELNDFSLEEEIQNFQSSGRLSKTKLSSLQWSALVFVLLTSERELDVFDLRKYSLDNADECLRRMLPVIMASRTAELRNCNLSENSFPALASALNSKSSNLKELKLSGNTLHGSGVTILSEGFKSAHCKLEILELSDCNITADDCTSLTSALNSNPSFLRELDLSFNLLGDFGMNLLSGALRNPCCRLEKLKLFSCELTVKSCKAMSRALRSNCHLTELDLSKNTLQDSGAKLLSDGLKSPRCKLRSLSLTDCRLTDVGCLWLCTALKCNPSHLREFCLNRNRLRNTGVKIISDLLKEPNCKLEKLSLSYCDVSEEGCATLASALVLNPSYLKELQLIGNKPGDVGRRRLSALQEHKDYRLEKLQL